MKINYKIKDRKSYTLNGRTYYIGEKYKLYDKIITIKSFPGDELYDSYQFKDHKEGCLVEDSYNWYYLNRLKEI